MTTTLIDRWKQQARQLKRESLVLYLACRHPGTPWYVKALAILIVAYAFSPIDLIPDPIPILGALDDLLLLPLGIYLALRWVPPAVIEECRAQAQALEKQDRPTNWVAAGAILLLWLLVAVWLGRRMLTWLTK